MSFDLIARHYRWLETAAFGNALQNARVYWINEIRRPKRALLVGEGNGRFLCELLRIYPGIEVDCIDASRRMLELARSHVKRLRPESSRFVRFLQCDVRCWSTSDSYDLIVTHFFLDCFGEHELESIIARLAAAAGENAIWLIADFVVPKEFFARLNAILWLQSMYTFFGMFAGLKTKRLVNPRACLEGAGFANVSTRHFRSRMLQTDVFLRRTGSPLSS